ncbi:uncharacterized protein VTP21DRAFT_4576 [Calcarisporiella thermophila]|uniref:uncharacterized protein n=1 Tax=Calcarisporiella thermophila TaxID=911321 RepID=UPI00374465AF
MYKTDSPSKTMDHASRNSATPRASFPVDTLNGVSQSPRISRSLHHRSIPSASLASERSHSPVSTLRVASPYNPMSATATQASRTDTEFMKSTYRLAKLPGFPVKLRCIHCKNVVTSEVVYRNGTLVWLVAFGLLLLTIVLAWVPFILDSCKDIEHKCPRCGRKIARQNRI